MKDQYTGDVNDFWKYALLRALGSVWLGRLRVCWMLTPPDERADGRLLGYLDDPLRFRAVDAELFDCLGSLISSGQRSVLAVQSTKLLRDVRFHSGLLSDGRLARASYFEEVFDASTGEDLLFFDPDNGLEVTSVPKGRRGSSRYLYWDEMQLALEKAGAVCIYQHFPRVARERFIRRLLARALELAPGRQAFAVYSARVAYLVLPRDGAAKQFSAQAHRLVERSGDLQLLTL